MKARVVVIIFSALLAGVLCVMSGEAVAEDITIGVLVDLSSPNGAIGRMQRDSYLLALDEINDAGGIDGEPIQLDFRDTGGKPAAAGAIVKYFIEDKGYPLIMGGTGSRATAEAAEVCQKRRFPYLAVSGAKDGITRKGYDYVFRLGPTLGMYPAGAVQFLRDMIDPSRVAVIYERSLFADRTMKPLKDAGKNHGWELRVFPYDFGTDDFQPLLSRVEAFQPDAVYVISYGDDAARIVSGLREADVRAKAVIGGSPVFSSEEFLRAAGKDADGVFFVSIWSPKLAYPGADLYSEAFLERFGSRPDYHGAQAYSAVYVARWVLQKSRSRGPEDIRKALASTGYKTAFGPVRFRSKGGYTNQNMPPTYLQQWIDGEPEIVWPPDTGTAAPLIQ